MTELSPAYIELEEFQRRHAEMNIPHERQKDEEPPRPLTREMPPPQPFPAQALGPVLGPAVEGIHDRVQAPVPIVAQSVIGAAALAAQGLCDVQLPTGQCRPLSLFLVSIASSGERKSACDVEALAPIRAHEAVLRDRYDTDLPHYLNAKDAWEKQRAQILADKRAYPNQTDKRQALDALGNGPVAPLLPVLTSQEPTLPGLHRMLAFGQPAVGVFATEGGMFVAGHGMNQENKIATAAGLSALWDGETVRRVRAGDGVVVLHGRRVSMHLMMQPDIGLGLMSDPVLRDQGLVSRLLTVAPETAAGRRPWREPKAESATALSSYKRRLLDLLDVPLPVSTEKPNELHPRQLPLTADAREAWIAFVDHVEHALAPDGAYEAIRPLANKLGEHAARLASVLAVVEDPNTTELSQDHLAAGILLAQHYAAEALRLAEAVRLDPELKLAQRTLDWLRNDWSDPVVALVDLYQRGPAAIRDSKTARRVAAVLEEHGWLRRIDGGFKLKGIHRKDVWRIRKE